MQDLLILKKIKIKKRSKSNFVRKNLKKISIVIKKVTGSEFTLTHKAERPSNYVFQLFHTLSGWADKERSNLCPNFVRNTSA